MLNGSSLAGGVGPIRGRIFVGMPAPAFALVPVLVFGLDRVG